MGYASFHGGCEPGRGAFARHAVLPPHPQKQQPQHLLLCGLDHICYSDRTNPHRLFRQDLLWFPRHVRGRLGASAGCVVCHDGFGRAGGFNRHAGCAHAVDQPDKDRPGDPRRRDQPKGLAPDGDQFRLYCALYIRAGRLFGRRVGHAARHQVFGLPRSRLLDDGQGLYRFCHRRPGQPFGRDRRGDPAWSDRNGFDLFPGFQRDPGHPVRHHAGILFLRPQGISGKFAQDKV